MKNIAIITARSGSKGLPDKNIRLLKGKPLMAYTIEAALESGMFDTVHVSTDSEKYAEIARQYGADQPFLRSAETSSDTASSWAAVLEVLERYKELGKEFDTFTLLQPTSPLRTGEDIRNAYALFEEKQAYSVISMREVEDSPVHSYNLPEDHKLDEVIKNNPYRYTRRQEIPKFHRANGAIYISDVKEFLRLGLIGFDRSYAYIMDKMNSVDVDDLLDFVIAESILTVREQKNGK